MHHHLHGIMVSPAPSGACNKPQRQSFEDLRGSVCNAKWLLGCKWGGYGCGQPGVMHVGPRMQGACMAMSLSCTRPVHHRHTQKHL